jgi:hypothetical protein
LSAGFASVYSHMETVNFLLELVVFGKRSVRGKKEFRTKPWRNMWDAAKFVKMCYFAWKVYVLVVCLN